MKRYIQSAVIQPWEEPSVHTRIEIAREHKLPADFLEKIRATIPANLDNTEVLAVMYCISDKDTLSLRLRDELYGALFDALVSAIGYHVPKYNPKDLSLFSYVELPNGQYRLKLFLDVFIDKLILSYEDASKIREEITNAANSLGYTDVKVMLS